MGIEEKAANTIAHDHIYGNHEIHSLVFMFKRLNRTDITVSNGYDPQRTFYDFV